MSRNAQKPQHNPLYFPVTAGMIALSGGLVMLVMSQIMNYDSWFKSSVMSVFATTGALVAGAATATLFGRKNWTGWVLATFGAHVATCIGATIGGPLYFLLGDAFFGVSEGMDIALHEVAMLTALLMALVVYTTPTGLVWALLMIAIHLIARRLRNPA